ncbi:hypothetical protein AB0F91_07165 [Amycolatopsis sp. NPDC023774]|uniref:hypothetical protein n=1 Tax=Amycolatopsis sp. NPDC023774 TaxID=3155015 RepID=UPI0033E3385B
MDGWPPGDEDDVTELAEKPAQAAGPGRGRCARALKDVRTANVRTIAVNRPLYPEPAKPAYGAAGQARQQQFATTVTQALQALVAAKTQGLPAPAKASDTDTLLDKVGDVAGMVAAGAGGPASSPGVDVVAAPAATPAGTTALTAHAIDMIGTDSHDDPNA